MQAYGVRTHKISTIVDFNEKSPCVGLGVRTHKISTIVDKLQSRNREINGVRTYKISTIVDNPLNPWSARLGVNTSKFLLL